MKNLAFSELGRRTTEPPISWLMKLSLDRPRLISLAAGFTDNVSLPVEETQAVLEELFAGSDRARRALQYGSTIGDARLRGLTVERIARQDGRTGGAVYCPDRLLITHGSQQLLYLAVECLCDPGDILLVEDPTYFVFLGILQSRGVRGRGIAMTADGLDLGALERVLESLRKAGDLRRVKGLYLVTYHQNPTGTTTVLERKAGALELLRRYEKAAGHRIYVIEDAAYRELRFAGPDTPSGLVLSGAGQRLIYAGTYSKPYATGIRVGFALVPEPLFTVMARVKGNHDFGTAHFLQHILVGALESGRYDVHLPALRKRYASKAAIMTEALKRHFPRTVRWQLPNGGMYIWARLPEPVWSGPKSRLFRLALERDVLYVPGELCYAPDPSRPLPRNEMRLSFGGAADKDIAEGIARLGEAVKGAGQS